MIGRLISVALLLPAFCSSSSAGTERSWGSVYSAHERLLESALHYEQLEESSPPVVAHPHQETLEDVGTSLLAKWISESRKDALAAGVNPVPSAVRMKLSGFFPDKLLNRAHYRVGEDNDLSLQTNAFRLGDADAVTLGDVIVFRNKRDAASNYTLWAHEMGHVQQYQVWGIEGFARRYIEDYQAVEQEANEVARRFVIWSHDRKMAH